jgi:hypothetical protein
VQRSMACGSRPRPVGYAKHALTDKSYEFPSVEKQSPDDVSGWFMKRSQTRRSWGLFQVLLDQELMPAHRQLVLVTMLS